MRNILPAAALALCVPLAAQDHFTPSPQSGGAEGSTSVDLIGSASTIRFQQVDGFTLGDKSNRNRMKFRRDGLLATNPAYVGRDLTMTVYFGEGNLTTATSDFEANYIGGTKTKVIDNKTISLSGWEAQPATPPAPQGDTLPFDVLHHYLGKNATGNDWVWEVQIHSNTQAGQPYPMDADIVMPTEIVGSGARFGFGGCLGINSSSSITNKGTSFDFFTSISGAEAGVPAAMMIGGPANIQVPGWCGPFETSLLIYLPLGLTDPAGAASFSSSLAYTPAAIGGDLYMQPLAIQPSAPGSVGIGWTRLVTVPADPPTTPQAMHHWAGSDTATNSTSGLIDGGIIILTNHT